MKMKLRLNPNSTLPRISKHEVIHSSETTRQDEYFECITDCHIDDQLCNEECVNTLKNEYIHPWYLYHENGCTRKSDNAKLIRPNPPSQQAVEQAKFVDRTYHWDRDTSNRRRN